MASNARGLECHPARISTDQSDHGLTLRHASLEGRIAKSFNPHGEPMDINFKTATRDEFIVEVVSLERRLKEVCTERARLAAMVNELTQQLGQAEAGIAMADLIKRMIS
jgi:hypothetical protein